MIYKDEKGRRYIALSDEQKEDLDWNPEKLLELDYDGIGWIIRPSSSRVARYLPNGINEDKVCGSVAAEPSLVGGPSKT